MSDDGLEGHDSTDEELLDAESTDEEPLDEEFDEIEDLEFNVEFDDDEIPSNERAVAPRNQQPRRRAESAPLSLDEMFDFLPKPTGLSDGERLQKVLSRAGIGSRRACEILIEARRVRGERRTGGAGPTR